MRSWRLIIIFAICYALSFSLLGYERLRVRMTASEVKCIDYALETSSKEAIGVFARTVYEEDPFLMANETFDTVFSKLTENCSVSFKDIRLTFYLNDMEDPDVSLLALATSEDHVSLRAVITGGKLKIPGSEMNIDREIMLSLSLDEKGSIK